MEKELLNLERDKIKAKNSKQYKEAAEICNYRGVLFASKGRFADALNEHNEELHFCRLNRDILGESIACRKIGECYAEMEQFDEALEKQMRYWKLAEKANDAVEVQRAWTTLGRTYFLQYSSDTSNTQALSFAETATRKSLQVAEKLKTNSAIKEKDLNEMICRSYLNLALIYEANGNTECVECYLEAIKLAKKYNFKEDLYRCEMNLANFYLKTDPFYVHLLKLFDNAIKDAKELKNSAFLCEAYLSKAKALLLRTDYAGSCYCFKKAFFSQSPVEEDRENARKCSKCVSRILRNLKELNESQSMQVKMDLCDKLGDDFTALKCYKKAIEYYKMELSFAEKLNKSKEALATIHVSLGQTYIDDKDFAKALHHFSEELKLRNGNIAEEVNSSLKIIEVKIALNFDSSLIINEYEKILNKIGENINLKRLVLEDYRIYLTQENINSDKLREIELILETLKAEDIEEDLNVIEADSESDQSEPSDFTDSDSENEEKHNLIRKSRRKRGGKNEKGETLLHRACIEGNFRQVKSLIEKGVSINERDNCGWLPIHEAANFGFSEIVEYLIEHGADINDRGGQFCEGITPLHDACINGHTNVIRVLLRKGANVTALDNSGNTPLDCLKNCRSRLDNLSSSEEEDYDSVARELENAMKKVGYDFKQSKSLKRRSFDLPFEQNERDSISRNPNLSRKIHRKQKLTSTKSYCEENFVSEYECAMMSLRRQNDPGYDPKRRRLSPTASYNVSPLLDESEVLIDDWLIDDTGSSSKQALSMDRFRNKPRETLRSTGESSSRLRQNFTSCHISKDKNEERRKVDESESDMIECESNTSDNDSTCDVNLLETCETVTESEMCPEINIDNQNYFSESNSVSTTSSSRTFEQNVSNKMSNFHVRVHIEGIILLINVTDKESTIRWLAEATSQRYYQMKQMKPTLSLKTRDGALLCFDDKIIDVLMDDNLQLDAIVELWESQSPYERFIDQCKFLKVTPQPELETILRMTSENGLLNLNHTLLPQNQLKPLLNAIKHQEIIDCVDLSYSNILFIDRSSEFISTILSLPRLQQLNLECAGVTMSHLRVISTSKSNVNQLNLSYNSLNDSNSEILTQVFAKFAYLKKIDLRFCDFTSNLFTQSFLQSLEKSALDEVLIDEFCKSEISDTNLNSSKVRFCNI